MRFVSIEPQPGLVECLLVDALGESHSFIEKTAVISNSNLGPDSSYPQPGIIACEIVAVGKSDMGVELAEVDSAMPWSIESTEGATEFTVLRADLIEFSWE